MDRRTLLAGLSASLAMGCSSEPSQAIGEMKLTGFQRTNWSRDPLAYGSYSYVSKLMQSGDRAALAAPVGEQLYFAGEACHPDYNSTVHAAYESGVMAAEQVAQTSAGRIAIIGAGMSGLAAAHALAKAGREVTVFEARDRIGGRVWTSQALGAPVDLGASWIHGPKGNPLTDLSDTLDLTRMETDDSYVVRDDRGKKLGLFSTPGWLTEIAEVQASYGADLEQIDFDIFDEGDGYSGDDVIFKQGYAAIFEALEGDYRVELSSSVTKIALGDEAVALRLEGKQDQSFDAVIVTVPLGVLKAGSIAFDPPLPPAKQAAIERIGMGVLDKLYLQFEEVFWDDKTWILTPETGLPRGQLNQWLNLHRYIGEPILVAFNGGSSALALAEMSDEAMVETALGILGRAYPG